MNGKSGTITPEEFDTLAALYDSYGGKVLASKVALVCSKKAEVLKHEYPSSSVAAAYASVGNKIKTAVGTSTTKIGRDAFSALSSLVNTYGAEVITMKLAKLAKRNEATADFTTLKSIFPRSA